MLLLCIISSLCVNYATSRELPQSIIKADVGDDLEQIIRLSRNDIKRLARLEGTLVSSGIHIKPGSPEHGQIIEGWPEMASVEHSQAALVASRVAIRFTNTKCSKYGRELHECVLHTLQRLSLNSSSLAPQACHSTDSDKCNNFPRNYRTPDGSCVFPNDKGRSFTPYRRLLPPLYSDGLQFPRFNKYGRELPSPRALSLALSEWRHTSKEHPHMTIALALWTQFILNDLSHTPVSKMVNTFSAIECCGPDGETLAPRHRHPDCMPIRVDEDDPAYRNNRVRCINYVRSTPAIVNECHLGPREQMNQATHYLDGSSIYGSSEKISLDLRSSKGKGRLEVQEEQYGDLLPKSREPNHRCQYAAHEQNSINDTCFRAGDSRVNLHPQLTLMHTIWVREHNRIAGHLAEINPLWDNERLYQETRRIVIAQIQHITFAHWLPTVFGREVSSKIGLNVEQNESESDSSERMEFDQEDPSVSNAFAHAAMRFAENMMDDDIKLYSESREFLTTLQLHEHFNRPDFIKEPNAIENLLRGLTTQKGLQNDLSYEPDFSHSLYRNHWKFGFDLFALDIQRGRDHGLPSYKHFKQFCKISNNTISNKLELLLKELYGSFEDIDLIVGGLAEDPIPGGILGPTFTCIIEEQLIKTRMADKYFYARRGNQSSFSKDQLNEIKKSSLARIFCDNSNIKSIQPEIFHIQSTSNSLADCASNTIPYINLQYWKE